jgi:ribosomal protein L12E/L44/L45/RPP1/RPP2
VVGNMDIMTIAIKLRKAIGYADIISVSPAKKKNKEKKKEEKKEEKKDENKEENKEEKKEEKK